MKIKLSTYVEGQHLYEYRFFILNKGLNSGKPSFTPWTNCFIAQFDSDDELDYAYWMCYGLWVTRKLHPFLNGSVIPFICKDDLLMALELADAAIHDHRDLYMQSIEMLYEAEHNREVLTAKAANLQKAKTDILRHFIRI